MMFPNISTTFVLENYFSRSQPFTYRIAMAKITTVLNKKITSLMPGSLNLPAYSSRLKKG